MTDVQQDIYEKIQQEREALRKGEPLPDWEPWRWAANLSWSTGRTLEAAMAVEQAIENGDDAWARKSVRDYHSTLIRAIAVGMDALEAIEHPPEATPSNGQ